MQATNPLRGFGRVGIAALLAAVLGTPAASQVTTRVSVDSSGIEGNNACHSVAVSADGRYVAFGTDSSNLDPSDFNMMTDVYLRDRLAGTTERISVDSAGVGANGISGECAISSDGNYVAFTSNATNLPGTGPKFGIYLRDRTAGTTTFVSVDSGGAFPDDHVYDPWLSPDARYLLFYGDATNLVAGDTNAAWDVFLRDLVASTTERVSVGAGGVEGNGGSRYGAASDDGRYVAFDSDATNLVPGDTNGATDVFVRDRTAGTTERVSVDSSGAEANGSSEEAAISADGRYVAFWSLATNLVAGDTNGNSDVFVHDRTTGATERVSVDSGGLQAAGWSWNASISGDGRYVAFSSTAANLAAGDANGDYDVFLRDRVAGTTQCMSLVPGGTPGNSGSSNNAITPDGRYVAFNSAASNLVVNDQNGKTDTFIRDRAATAFTSMCHPGHNDVISCPCGQPGNATGGCANFGPGATSGAVLSASGLSIVSADTLLLETSNHRAPLIGVLNVFFSFKPGTVTNGVASGAGVRCTSGGDLRRLYTMQVMGGAGSKPEMGDPSVSARSAALPGHAIAPPETRYYFNVYRDGQASGPCGSSSVSTNLTNMGAVLWTP